MTFKNSVVVLLKMEDKIIPRRNDVRRQILIRLNFPAGCDKNLITLIIKHLTIHEFDRLLFACRLPLTPTKATFRDFLNSEFPVHDYFMYKHHHWTLLKLKGSYKYFTFNMSKKNTVFIMKHICRHPSIKVSVLEHFVVSLRNTNILRHFEQHPKFLESIGNIMDHYDNVFAMRHIRAKVCLAAKYDFVIDIDIAMVFMHAYKPRSKYVFRKDSRDISEMVSWLRVNYNVSYETLGIIMSFVKRQLPIIHREH